MTVQLPEPIRLAPAVSGFIVGEPVQYAGLAARQPCQTWEPARLERETRLRALQLELRCDEQAYADRVSR